MLNVYFQHKQFWWQWHAIQPNGFGGGCTIVPTNRQILTAELIGAMTLLSIPHLWCHLEASLIAQSTWIHTQCSITNCVSITILGDYCAPEE